MTTPSTPIRVPRDILVVDDDKRNLLAIEAALGDFGGRLIKASSGDEALRFLLANDCALILLDVQMPHMDGFETARLIRSRPRTQHVPIIFVTAYEQSAERILEGYELGAVDLLFKPIAAEVLRAKASVFVMLQQRTAEVLQQAEMLHTAQVRDHQRELEEQRQRLEAVALRRKTEEQQRAAQQLERINARLTEADRRKDEFLAMLGHELRTPLAPLLFSLDLLRTPSADVPRLVGVMDRQLKHLVRLVDDLLDVSRITSGRVELCVQRVALSTILDQACAAVLPAIEVRGHELLRIEPSHPLWLDVDPVRMGQVVSNLLSNAARYTDPGGYLELHAFVEDERLVVRVIDNGRGIPEALMGRIFDPFVQERVGTGGLGIGLTLVQRLTELHGGSVDAYSRGRGRGSSFTLNLPAPDLAPRQTTPGSGTAALTRGLRVLVVDDSRDIRESLGELIATWGHHVALADNGDDALALLLHDCPDVAIIDLALPGIDGYAIAERVRAAALARPPTLIALTGFGGEQLRRRALAAGFDEHVVKPPEPRALRALLRGQPPLTQRSHHVNP